MAEARKLNPDMAAVLIAEADLAPPGAYAQRMALLERAVERNPESAGGPCRLQQLPDAESGGLMNRSIAPSAPPTRSAFAICPR